MSDTATDSDQEEFFPSDDAPQGGKAVRSKKAPAKKAPGVRKKPGPKPRNKGPGVGDSIAFLYGMAGTSLSMRGADLVGGALQHNAQPCGKAWEDFLSQWPAISEWMERFSVGPAAVQLIIVHMPILEAARMQAQQAAAMAAAVNGDQPPIL